MSTPGFGNSGVRMHGPWLAVGSWDWSSGKSLCVFMCVLLCSLCQCLKEMIGSWFQRDWPSGLYLCGFWCLCSGFCFARSLALRWGLSVFDFVCVSVSQCLFKTHGWKLELAMEPRARERVVVVVWICHVIMCIICLYVCFWVSVWALSTHEWLEDKTI